MGRALVREPRAFLMDEPLSNLDAKLRTSMRGELARLHERLPTTTVYVTHDQVEAMTLGERVAVLRDGVVQQCDVPQRLFDHPANLFVGAFIGSPAMNLVRGAACAGRRQLRRAPSCARAAGDSIGERRSCSACGRPASPSRGRRAIRAGRGLRVDGSTSSSSSGSECNLLFAVDAPPVATDEVKAAIGGESGVRRGQAPRRRPPRSVHGSDPGAARPTAPGEAVELAIDPTQLHLFDRETGRALELEQPVEKVA